MSALPLASALHSMMWIFPFLNYLYLCKNILWFCIFSFFLTYSHHFTIIYTLILPVSQLIQTQQLMKSHIRSHVDYNNIQTYIIFLCSFILKIHEKSSLTDGCFWTQFYMMFAKWLLFGPPCSTQGLKHNVRNTSRIRSEKKRNVKQYVMLEVPGQ